MHLPQKQQIHFLSSVLLFSFHSFAAPVAEPQAEEVVGQSSNRDGLMRVCSNPKHIALTFDDGPSENLGDLVKILKDGNAKATFFFNGDKKKVAKNKAIEEAIEAGMSIQNHGFKHDDSVKTLKTGKKVVENIKKLEGMLTKEYKVTTKYWRPPYGSYNDAIVAAVKEAGYDVVYWQLDTLDWEKRDKRKMNVLDDYLKGDAPEGPIVLAHETQKHTLDWARKTIAQYSGEYQFVTIEECLAGGITSANGTTESATSGSAVEAGGSEEEVGGSEGAIGRTASSTGEATNEEAASENQEEGQEPKPEAEGD